MFVVFYFDHRHRQHHQQCGHVLSLVGRYLAEHHDDLCASKLCQLITIVVSKQRVRFSGSHGNQIVEYLLSLARRSHKWLLADTLRSLSYSLFELDISPLTQLQTLEIVTKHARLSNADLQVRRQALNCLGSLCTTIGGNNTHFTEQHYQTIVSIIMENLDYYANQVFVDRSIIKITTVTMNALAQVAARTSVVAHLNNFDGLITKLKRLMFYGTRVSPTNYTNQLSSEEEGMDRSNRFHTSESEFVSDGDGSNRHTPKIRCQAMMLISAITKSDMKSMFSQWRHFIPDHGALDPHPRYNPSLSTILLFDTSTRCRSSAAQTINSLLENSKPFLAQADDKK